MHRRHLTNALLAAVLDPGRALLRNVPDALLLLAEALACALGHSCQALPGLLLILGDLPLQPLQAEVPL